MFNLFKAHSHLEKKPNLPAKFFQPARVNPQSMKQSAPRIKQRRNNCNLFTSKGGRSLSPQLTLTRERCNETFSRMTPPCGEILNSPSPSANFALYSHACLFSLRLATNRKCHIARAVDELVALPTALSYPQRAQKITQNTVIHKVAENSN